MNTKKCSRCGLDKPLAEFYRRANRPSGLEYYCADCGRLRQQGMGEAKRRSWLKQKYNITLEQYEGLQSACGMMCPVCLSPMLETSKPVTPRMMCVDHDHESGRVRGLLCHSCNKAIGILKDDAECLSRALGYLTNPPANGVIYDG